MSFYGALDASGGWTAWHSHPFAGKCDGISALNFDTPSRSPSGLGHAAAEFVMNPGGATTTWLLDARR
jgi:hypothetical protein